MDYIDYYLLHMIGGGGMEQFRKRYIDNGMIDFLVKEREAGRIRLSLIHIFRTGRQSGGA